MSWQHQTESRNAPDKCHPLPLFPFLISDCHVPLGSPFCPSFCPSSFTAQLSLNDPHFLPQIEPPAPPRGHQSYCVLWEESLGKSWGKKATATSLPTQDIHPVFELQALLYNDLSFFGGLVHGFIQHGDDRLGCIGLLGLRCHQDFLRHCLNLMEQGGKSIQVRCGLKGPTTTQPTTYFRVPRMLTTTTKCQNEANRSGKQFMFMLNRVLAHCICSRVQLSYWQGS